MVGVITGEKLKLIRTLNNVKGTQLAKRMGFTRQYLYMIENNNERPISDEQMRKIIEMIYVISEENKK